MRVRSTLQIGYRHDGQPLLNVGENVLAEPLSIHEREFIDAMVQAGVVEIVVSEAPPASETKLIAAAPVKRMRIRRAKVSK